MYFMIESKEMIEWREPWIEECVRDDSGNKIREGEKKLEIEKKKRKESFFK